MIWLSYVIVIIITIVMHSLQYYAAVVHKSYQTSS